MLHKRFNLFLIGMLAIMLLFKVPVYRTWLNDNVLGRSLPGQFWYVGAEQRRVARYGQPYELCRHIADTLNQLHEQNAVILLPPAAYARAMGNNTYYALEPAVFYYYCGQKSVLAGSPGAGQANWMVAIDSGKVNFRKIHDKQELETLLSTYKTYKPEL